MGSALCGTQAFYMWCAGLAAPWHEGSYILEKWKLVTQSCPNLRLHGLRPVLLLCAMEFSRQEYWGGLPFPSPGDHPNLGIEPGSPALEADSLPTEPPGKPLIPGPGIKPMSPDFEGWFLTTGPPRKSLHGYFYSFFIDEETESEVWREHSREIQVRPCLSKYHVCLQESSVSAASSQPPLWEYLRCRLLWVL